MMRSLPLSAHTIWITAVLMLGACDRAASNDDRRAPLATRTKALTPVSRKPPLTPDDVDWSCAEGEDFRFCYPPSESMRQRCVRESANHPEWLMERGNVDYLACVEWHRRDMSIITID